MPRRRQKGSGSLSLRGNIWWIVYTAGGVPIRESTKTSDREKAENILKQRIGEVATGRDVAPEKATIDDLCSLVIADYRLRRLRDLAMVEWRYKGHIKPAMGAVQASRFGASQVRAYVAARRAEKASDATINRELAIVRRGFALGAREEPPMVRRIPYIAKLEEDNARQGFIEQGQYQTLLAELPQHLKCLLVIGYHCGNRLGELRKLQWSQVDLDANEIRIEKRQAKGKKPRTLPIYGDMKEWLERQREFSKGDRVFCWKQPAKRVEAKEKALGSHLKGWAEACTEAGLDGLHFHDLRRSAVRNMERAGIPRAVAMSISGHRTESVYRRYDIVAESDLKSAGEKLAAYHRQQKPKLRRVK